MGPAAVIFAATSKCKVCSPNLPPHASHNGCLPFLISKESIDSLINNQQDHGLDYHLRIAFRVEHQVAHFVGSVLEDHRSCTDYASEKSAYGSRCTDSHTTQNARVGD